MPDLSNSHFSRQDFIDNSIHELINKLNPTQKQIPWNIELIGEIRDALENIIVNKLNLCSQKNSIPKSP